MKITKTLFMGTMLVSSLAIGNHAQARGPGSAPNCTVEHSFLPGAVEKQCSIFVINIGATTPLSNSRQTFDAVNEERCIAIKHRERPQLLATFAPRCQ